MTCNQAMGRIISTMNKPISDENKLEFIKQIIEFFENALKEAIDWDNLTQEDAEMLGFIPWTDDEGIEEEIKNINNSDKIENDLKPIKIENVENTRNLWLIPQYLINLIPPELDVVNIFGDKDKAMNLVDQNDDERFGVLCYGIILDK
jgi:hypothetical protein